MIYEIHECQKFETGGQSGGRTRQKKAVQAKKLQKCLYCGR
jgi:hypothetical protein